MNSHEKSLNEKLFDERSRKVGIEQVRDVAFAKKSGDEHIMKSCIADRFIDGQCFSSRFIEEQTRRNGRVRFEDSSVGTVG